jgi:hypothetical protein
LAGVERPAEEQPDDYRDVDDEVEVALEPELVGDHERHKERDGHTAEQPCHMPAHADGNSGRRGRPRGRNASWG